MEYCAKRVCSILATLLALWALPLAAADLSFVTIEAAPWAYRDAAGRPAGAFPEIAAALARHTGTHITVALYPLARIDQAMETGAHDCTIVLWNDRRAPHVVRGEDVYPMPFGVIARAGTRLTGYGDLAPLAISVTRGLAMHARFDTDIALHKEIDRDYLTGLHKLARGRIDAVAGALPTIRHIARQAGLDSYLGDSLALGHVPLALQCSRRSARLGAQAEFDAALRVLRADGSLARILASHGYF